MDNEKIIEALKPTELRVFWNVYETEYDEDGNELPMPDKWLVFNYEDNSNVLAGNNQPLLNEVKIQVHLYTPVNFNEKELVKKIRRLLFDSGYTYPKLTFLQENRSKTLQLRHTVFSCSILESEEI